MDVEDEDAFCEFRVEERDGAVGQDAEVTAELEGAELAGGGGATVLRTKLERSL